MDVTMSLILAGALVVAVTGIVNRMRPASQDASRSGRRSRDSGYYGSSDSGGGDSGGDCAGDGGGGDCGGGDGGGGGD